jgi:protection-of-telomeres protein 1
MAADNFRSISIACSSPAVYTVLGVVVDTLPIFRTKGSSKCVTFTIKDSHFDLPSWSGGLKVKYFSDDDSHIPNVKIDDVVLLRNIKVGESG